jgi:mono/diheme cytochrome c family protein
MTPRMRIALVAAAFALGCAVAGALALHWGVYDVAATEQHYRPTYWLLEVGMRRSVQVRARGIEVPPLEDPALIERGLVIYRAHCSQCHGAPGVAPEPFALGLTPIPANLAHAARSWTAAELFWIVKNGVKMTGMPGWEFRLAERDLWAAVAFMRQLPNLSPRQYAESTRASGNKPLPFTTDELTNAAADAASGKRAILQYGCAACHNIPGVVGAYAPVGPPLDGVGTRQFLGGVIVNTPENMVRWLRHPREIEPDTAMPDLGVSERDARDIAAYLYTLQ